MPIVENPRRKVNANMLLGPLRWGEGLLHDTSFCTRCTGYCHRRQTQVNIAACTRCFEASVPDGIHESSGACAELNVSTHPADLPADLQHLSIIAAAIDRAELIGIPHPVQQLLEAHPSDFLQDQIVRALTESGHPDWGQQLAQMELTPAEEVGHVR